MACSCSLKGKSGSAKWAVVDKSGTKVKTYSNSIEAQAHASRIGGKVVQTA